MVDSELNELVNRKTKRILLWICGISAVGVIITIITLLVLAGAQPSAGD